MLLSGWSCSPVINHMRIILDAPITTDTIVTFMVRSFFVLQKGLHFFVFQLLLILFFSLLRQQRPLFGRFSFFFLLTITRYSSLAETYYYLWVFTPVFAVVFSMEVSYRNLLLSSLIAKKNCQLLLLLLLLLLSLFSQQYNSTVYFFYGWWNVGRQNFYCGILR